MQFIASTMNDYDDQYGTGGTQIYAYSQWGTELEYFAYAVMAVPYSWSPTAHTLTGASVEFYTDSYSDSPHVPNLGTISIATGSSWYQVVENSTIVSIAKHTVTLDANARAIITSDRLANRSTKFKFSVPVPEYEDLDYRNWGVRSKEATSPSGSTRLFLDTT